MAAPITYSRTYTYTGRDNTSFGSTAGASRSVGFSSFRIGGNTSEPIGKITKIEFQHYHSATNSNSGKVVKLRCQLVMGGTTITSDTVTQTIRGTVVRFTNTFSENLPDAQEFAQWSSARIVLAAAMNNSTLYWRATSSQPIKITVYFWSAADMVDGSEDPPTVGSSIGMTDGAAFGDSTILEHFGAFVQRKSEIVLTGDYTIDHSYEFISAAHTLTITDSGGEELYTATQTDDPVFHVGALDAGGVLTAVYTVRDNGGLSASRSYSITVLPYAPPTITASVVRWAEDLDGNRAESADGDHVWISLNASASPLGNHNTWAITLLHDKITSPMTVADSAGLGTYGLTIAENGDSENTLLGSVTFDASRSWDFVFTISDAFETASIAAAVDEAGALANVYNHGVAVGMRGTGTEDNKLFEVAEDHATRLYGGLSVIGRSLRSQHALGIQCGELVSGGVNYHGYADIPVVFPEPFAEGSVPVVVVGFRTASTGYQMGSLSCAVKTDSETNTGFVIRVYNDDTTVNGVRNPRFTWIAIGITPDGAELSGVWQEGSVLHIVDGVTAVQDGNVLNIE